MEQSPFEMGFDMARGADQTVTARLVRNPSTGELRLVTTTPRNSMQHKERITLDDTLLSAMVKLSDGNPGAIGALVEAVRLGEECDPQSMLGKISPLLSLDGNGIYGGDIYLLFNDVCNRNVPKMLTLLRSVQMGMLPVQKVYAAISFAKQDGPAVEPFDFVTINAKLREQLEQFVVVS